MLSFNASAFYRATRHLDAFNSILRRVDQEDINVIRKGAVKALDDLDGALEVLDVKLTQMALGRLKDKIEKMSAQSSYEKEAVADAFREVTARLEDELSLLLVFVLESTRASYFSPDQPLFGAEFQHKFPAASFELDEASKCLALDRSTAAVFHLMRMLEIGIFAVAKSLGVPDPTKPAKRNWGEILRNLKAEIDEKNKNKSWSEQKDAEFFGRAHASLEAVRNVWRNATMHVENKYTEDEAEDIYNAVRGFMRTLASRLDENGHPLA